MHSINKGGNIMIERYMTLKEMLTKMNHMADLIEKEPFINYEELLQTILERVDECSGELHYYAKLQDAGTPHPWFDMLEEKIKGYYYALLEHLEDNGLVEYMVV